MFVVMAGAVTLGLASAIREAMHAVGELHEQVKDDGEARP